MWGLHTRRSSSHPPPLLQETAAFTRYLHRDELGRAVTDAGGRSWAKGLPSAKTDVIIMGDISRCHSKKKTDTNTGSGVAKAVIEQRGLHEVCVATRGRRLPRKRQR